MWYYIGNLCEIVKSIVCGWFDLFGLLVNLYIVYSGVVMIVVVGVCWYVGCGSYLWLLIDNVNWYMIGVECVWLIIWCDGFYDVGECWFDVQIVSM